MRVAATPMEAKVLVARLESDGIPAYVDGESLVDEIAITRRAMNLAGVRVLVHPSNLERAREVLAAEPVDEQELTRQALMAEQPELAHLRPVPPPPRPWTIVQRATITLLVTLAAVFLGLWQHAERSLASAYDMLPQTDGFRMLERRSGHSLLFRDRDENGSSDEFTFTGSRDGRSLRLTDDDADGLPDGLELRDAHGTALLHQTFDPVRGFIAGH